MTQNEIIEMARQAGCFEKHQVFYFTSQELEAFAKLVAEKQQHTWVGLTNEEEIEIGCSECGIGGGHALYCVRCAEKFVGGYKENVPVHASELLTQVSTDTQYAGNGTAGIQNETKPTGFFFQIPQQRTWVDLTDEESVEIQKISTCYEQAVELTKAKLKDKNI